MPQQWHPLENCAICGLRASFVILDFTLLFISTPMIHSPWQFHLPASPLDPSLSLRATDANLVIALITSLSELSNRGTQRASCLQLVPLQSALFAPRTVFLRSWPCSPYLVQNPLAYNPWELWSPLSSSAPSLVTCLLSSSTRWLEKLPVLHSSLCLSALHLDIPVRPSLLPPSEDVDAFLVLSPSFLFLQFYDIHCAL